MFIVKMFDERVQTNPDTDQMKHYRLNIGNVQFESLDQCRTFVTSVRHMSFATEVCYRSDGYTVPVHVIERLYDEMTQQRDLAEDQDAEEMYPRAAE